ncbi:divalent metal cation transporter [Rubellicoccus peritrichatus]|uniref:Divalent metal cation transporter n=1 Tax=Rubellicoccus peritrichatus TaxID=3080537 RepID=A0AAQ3QVY7_9BACT|nr:divalent metal cation transporter [Puniceicoccus sp. CR14]WOO41357.1 divalent metal cation transporter [Puniceicoccus sp. CR14]
MSTPQLEHDRSILRAGEAKGGLARIGAYVRLSGPGWLQSAITLGGGSLSTSLFLGVLGGVSLLWIQPLAMALGIIMLCAISYVTLSTGQKPFQLVKAHFNPVIAWAWIIATLLANVIWALPTFSLGASAVSQNLLSGTSEGMIAIGMLLLAVAIIWFYDTGNRGIKIFENLLKLIVALIVLSFVGVVFKMSSTEGGLDWAAIIRGFIPNVSQLTTPAEAFQRHLAELSGNARTFWEAEIVTQQRGVIFSGVTYAVGINMTFLLPCSQLAKGWDKDFRKLAVFDLSTSLLIPFTIATSCIVIAASNQFHAIQEKGLITAIDPSNGSIVLTDADTPNTALSSAYQRLLNSRLSNQGITLADFSPNELATMQAEMPLPEKQMAAMLVKRGALSLSRSLEPLMGRAFANYIFGFGVFAMTLSTIIVLMLINGFVACEMLGLPSTGPWHRLGCMLPGLGVLGPFIWQKASFWVVIPTATIGLVALPLAYLSFFALFNNRKLLGESFITGGKRIACNTLMLCAIAFVTFGCVWATYAKTGILGLLGILIFLILAGIAHIRRRPSNTLHTNG